MFNGLETFAGYLCAGGSVPTLSTAIPAALRETIAQSYFTDTPGDSRAPTQVAPTCRAQRPLGPATGSGSGLFPHLTALP